MASLSVNRKNNLMSLSLLFVQLYLFNYYNCDNLKKQDYFSKKAQLCHFKKYILVLNYFALLLFNSPLICSKNTKVLIKPFRITFIERNSNFFLIIIETFRMLSQHFCCRR